MDKSERAKLNILHNQDMENKYKNDNVCHLYTFNSVFDFSNSTSSKPISIEITTNDTVSEIINRSGSFGYICALNFASYSNPGGGFLEGSLAQEEGLCMYSNLYNILSRQHDYYNYNSNHKIRGAYEDRALYTEGVYFEKDGIITQCDIITCACPNKRVQRYINPVPWDNTKVLNQRAKFILDVAEDMGVNTLILGAWGCGVFEQDPNDVANAFKQALENNSYYGFDRIIFAIPPGENHIVFKEIFDK